MAIEARGAVLIRGSEAERDLAVWVGVLEGGASECDDVDRQAVRAFSGFGQAAESSVFVPSVADGAVGHAGIQGIA